jgi:hypothetical protein
VEHPVSWFQTEPSFGGFGIEKHCGQTLTKLLPDLPLFRECRLYGCSENFPQASEISSQFFQNAHNFTRRNFSPPLNSDSIASIPFLPYQELRICIQCDVTTDQGSSILLLNSDQVLKLMAIITRLFD